MKPLVLVMLAGVLGCHATAHSCRPGTIFVTVSLDATAAAADTLAVAVVVDGVTRTARGEHARGVDHGTIEIDFAAGYPQGKTVTVMMTALADGRVLASGSAAPLQLSASCYAIALRLSAPVAAGDMSSPVDLLALGDLPPAVADLTTPSSDLARGDLGVAFLSMTVSGATGTVDLTAEGTSDWAHWGYSLASDYDHKASGAGQISNYSVIGGQSVFQFSDGSVGYGWSDGAAGAGQHATSNASTTGIYIVGIGNGFRITAPADVGGRELSLYVGSYQGVGQLRAMLSDGAAPAVEDHNFGNATGFVNTVYHLHYAAGSSGQTLSVTWTMYSASGAGSNVTLQSATLRHD